MIIESIKEYLESLDCMKEFNNAININYLASNIDNFSIEESPTEPILKRYTNGSTVRQYDFIFCSREIYGLEVIQNIENSNFYEKLVNEIEHNNNIGKLPILDKGLESLELQVLTTPNIMSTEENTCIYQINIRLKYYKEA